MNLLTSNFIGKVRRVLRQHSRSNPTPLYQYKKPVSKTRLFIWRKRGIRTLGIGCPTHRFRERHLQPLGHLSTKVYLDYLPYPCYFSKTFDPISNGTGLDLTTTAGLEEVLVG